MTDTSYNFKKSSEMPVGDTTWCFNGDARLVNLSHHNTGEPEFDITTNAQQAVTLWLFFTRLLERHLNGRIIPYRALCNYAQDLFRDLQREGYFRELLPRLDAMISLVARPALTDAEYMGLCGTHFEDDYLNPGRKALIDHIDKYKIAISAYIAVRLLNNSIHLKRFDNLTITYEENGDTVKERIKLIDVSNFDLGSNLLRIDAITETAVVSENKWRYFTPDYMDVQLDWYLNSQDPVAMKMRNRIMAWIDSFQGESERVIHA